MRNFGVHCDLYRCNSVDGAHQLDRLGFHFFLDRTCGCRQHDAKRDVAALDFQVPDESELNDVFLQIGVDDLPQ